MADKEPESFFTIDAKVLLAKLHLAAKTQLPKVVVRNTGVPVEAASDSPEKPSDKCLFDLKSGPDYLVGIFMNFEFVPPYEDLDKDYKKTVTSAQKIDSDKIEEIENTLEKENEKLKADKAAEEKTMRKEVVSHMKTYFTHFAGKNNASKVSEKSIVPRVWFNTEKLEDLYNSVKFSGGKFVLPTDEELDKIQEETYKDAIEAFKKAAEKQTSDLSKVKVTQTFLFMSSYKVDLGK